MAEVTYIDITWTSGDVLTESKLDSMVANGRAVDAMYNGIEFAERASPNTPASNKLHLYCKDKLGVPTLYVINDAAEDIELSERHSTFYFPFQDTLVTGTSVCPIIIVTRAMTIVKAYGAVKTAPTGTSVIVDLNKNGSTIWSNQADRLTILASATTGNTTSFNTTTLADGDLLTMDIDQVGGTIAGADLTVALKCK